MTDYFKTQKKLCCQEIQSTINKPVKILIVRKIKEVN